MPISWIEVAIKLVPVAIAVIRQVLDIIEQMETEHRDNINLDTVKRELTQLKEPVEKLAEKLNGDLAKS